MSSRFTLVPRAEGPFRGLDLTSRCTFGLLYDRCKLSATPKNILSFTDEHGTFCVYERADLAQELGITLPTLRKAIKSLVDADVLIARRAGVGAAWRYYLTDNALRYLDDGYAATAAEKARMARQKAREEFYRAAVVNFDED